MSEGLSTLPVSPPAAAGEPSALRVWVLTEGRAGDDGQLLRLADALGGEQTPLALRDNTNWHLVLDRLYDLLGWARAPLRLPANAPAQWPDLVLAIAGRSVSTVRRIVAASGGTTRAVHLGRPVADLATFDLVVTTPQYGLPARPNVVHTALPFAPPVAPPQGGAEDAPFGGLPRPWTAVLVGGDSGSYRVGEQSAQRLIAACHKATADGGSVLVSTSPRTPEAVGRAVREALPERSYFYGFVRDDPDNPYAALLAFADRFVVTGESASLIAEAAAMERPVEIVPVEERPLARFLVRAHRALKRSPLGPMLDRLCARGLWVPPRDLEAVHEAFAARDAATGGRAELESVLERIRAVVPRAERRP